LAQINLGTLYANGDGVERDIEQAYLWFHVAAAQGYKAAFENKMMVEQRIKSGDNLATKLADLQSRAQQFFQLYVKPFSSVDMLR
jgi:TPR repeat protein